MDPLTTELLPALRRYLALSQARLAELLGISRMGLTWAETGARPLPAAGRVALAAWLAALPPATLAALATAPAHVLPPPAPALHGPPPDAPTLARHRHRVARELYRQEAALATHQARAQVGAARLALLAAPAAPDLGASRHLFELEARQWTDTLAAATQRVLQARCAGLRRELAVLDGTL